MMGRLVWACVRLIMTIISWATCMCQWRSMWLVNLTVVACSFSISVFGGGSVFIFSKLWQMSKYSNEHFFFHFSRYKDKKEFDNRPDMINSKWWFLSIVAIIIHKRCSKQIWQRYDELVINSKCWFQSLIYIIIHKLCLRQIWRTNDKFQELIPIYILYN